MPTDVRMAEINDRGEFQLKYRPKFLKGILYGFLSFLSIYLMYILGGAESRVYTDPILQSSTYQPFLIVFLLLIAIFWINRKRPVLLAYLSGILFVAFTGIAILTIPDISLIVFPIASAFLVIMMYQNLSDGFRPGYRRIAIFAAVTFIMFIIGGAVRFYTNPNEFTLLVGSIYDDENPLGVPFLFYNGIIFYGRFLVVTVSLPIIILFSLLASVLTENYLLIFKLSGFSRGRSASGIGKSANAALTALSCQCEGITAAFPSIVATLLLSAVIPLISMSIGLVALTNAFLAMYFLKGKRIRFLEKIWASPQSSRFFYLLVFLVFLIPLASLFAVYFGLERDLTVLSLLNVSMFIYGILIVYGFMAVVKREVHLSRIVLSSSIVLSSVLMFMWYYPTLTNFAAFSYSGFITMSLSSIAGGLLSGLVFKALWDSARRLYLQFITMMLTTLAIVVFYITSIALVVIYPLFGSTEQLLFALVLWGISLPFVWLSTNISLNYESGEALEAPFEEGARGISFRAEG